MSDELTVILGGREVPLVDAILASGVDLAPGGDAQDRARVFRLVREVQRQLVDQSEDMEYAELAHKREVWHRADAEGRRRAAQADAPPRRPPSSTSLSDLLAEPDDEPDWRIAGVWPIAGKVLVVAQYKAGKTTLLGNAIRSLVDGDPFLGTPDAFGSPGVPTFEVTPLGDDERVVLCDFEMTRKKLRTWLREQGVKRTDAVHVETFRGEADRFNVLDPAGRREWGAYLRDLGVRVLMVDPLGPLLSAYGLSENSNDDMGKLLYALDALVVESGASELVVAHHMGHSGERGRGASGQRGWLDAEWKLVREGPPGEEPPPDAARFFSALGRDVEVPEGRLHYDPATRRLSLGNGNRGQHAALRRAPEVLAYVTAHPGAGVNDMERDLLGDKKALKAARESLVRSGDLVLRTGPNRSQQHYLPADAPEGVSGAPK